MPVSVASPVEGTRLAPAIRALVRLALRDQGRHPGEIAVVLGDDALLRDLNRRYRRIPRTTDVLSFAYDEGPGRDRASSRGGRRDPARAQRAGVRAQRAGAGVSGDIVVSLERVVVQARRFRVSRAEELARLLVHGALHLAGLDHHVVTERRHMRACEERVLREARPFVRALERMTEGSGFRDGLGGAG